MSTALKLTELSQPVAFNGQKAKDFMKNNMQLFQSKRQSLVNWDDLKVKGDFILFPISLLKAKGEKAKLWRPAAPVSKKIKISVMFNENSNVFVIQHNGNK